MYVINKTSIFNSLVVLLLILISNLSFADNKLKEYCANYSELALKSVAMNNKLKCGFNGDRWINQDVHYKWCTKTRESISQKETMEREKMLSKCAIDLKNISYKRNDKTKSFLYKKHNLTVYNSVYYLPFVEKIIDFLPDSLPLNLDDVCSNKKINIDYSDSILNIKLFFGRYNYRNRPDALCKNYDDNNSYFIKYDYHLKFLKKGNNFCLKSAYYEYYNYNAYNEGIIENETEKYDFISNKVKITKSSTYYYNRPSEYTKNIKQTTCIDISNGIKLNFGNDNYW